MPYSDAEALVRRLSDITLHVMAIGKYRENSSKSDDDYDLEYLRKIAAITGGSVFEYGEKNKLFNSFQPVEHAANSYSFKELVISEEFPEGVEVLEAENITVSTDNRKLTARLPDVIFENGKGTPSPVFIDVKIKFTREGSYDISNISMLYYRENGGTVRKELDFNKPTEGEEVVMKLDISWKGQQIQGSLNTGFGFFRCQNCYKICYNKKRNRSPGPSFEVIMPI